MRILFIRIFVKNMELQMLIGKAHNKAPLCIAIPLRSGFATGIWGFRMPLHAYALLSTSFLADGVGSKSFANTKNFER